MAARRREGWRQGGGKNGGQEEGRITTRRRVGPGVLQSRNPSGCRSSHLPTGDVLVSAGTLCARRGTPEGGAACTRDCSEWQTANCKLQAANSELRCIGLQFSWLSWLTVLGELELVKAHWHLQKSNCTTMLQKTLSEEVMDGQSWELSLDRMAATEVSRHGVARCGFPHSHA